MIISETERELLVSCIEAGARAFQAGLKYWDNPYLGLLPMGRAVDTDEVRLQQVRAQAWWDGYEELEGALRAKPLLDSS